MNGDHVVKTELACLKGVVLAILNGKPFGQKDYQDVIKRLGRIENCWDCLSETIKKCTSDSSKE